MTYRACNGDYPYYVYSVDFLTGITTHVRDFLTGITTHVRVFMIIIVSIIMVVVVCNLTHLLHRD